MQPLVSKFNIRSSHGFFLWLCLCTCLVNSCNQRSEISADERSRIVSLGHGGMGISSSYPLNSAEGIQKCLELGLDGSELDVQLTADSVLVAFHDADMSEDTKLTGRIHAKTWNELENVKITGSLRTSCELVSLSDLFSQIMQPEEFHFTFDCKLHPVSVGDAQYHQQFVSALDRLLTKHSLNLKIAIESQNVDFLLACRQQLPNLSYYYYPMDFEEGFDVVTDHHFNGITMDSEKITSAQVEQCQSVGLKVALWNVKSPAANWDAINKRPDFIQSDEPRHLQNALK